jgi:GGDEF domain-containing protein
MVVAEKIRCLIAAPPFETRGGPIQVTSSFGVASTALEGPDLAVNVESLIKVADQCLYRSKAAGRNCTHGAEVANAAAQAAQA